MKKNILVIVVALMSVFGYSQKLEYTKYNWEEKLDIAKLELDEKEGIISLKEHNQEEFYFEKNSFFQVNLTHRLLWLNSDDAIEKFNKVYLPFNDTSEMLLSKARVIKADGTVLNLSKDKILTAKDEETKRQYKYYAMEGIEKGCFVEYLYAIKKYASYKGSRLRLQADYPKKNVSFELYAPKNLIFDFLTDDGLPKIEKDAIVQNKNRWSMKATSLEGLVEEQMAPYEALLKSVVFKLDRNTYNGTYGIASYDNFSQSIFDVYYGKISSKDAKVVKKLIKELKLNKLGKEKAVRALEDHLKMNFYIPKTNGIRPFKQILASKTANEYEMIKLFVQVCEALGVKSELVLTSNRYDLKFHKEFESGNFLQVFLLYFPKFDKYTSPSRMGDRLGYPMFSYMANYGLFIKKIGVNGFSTAVAKIEYIKPLPATASIAAMDVKVTFNEDFESTKIHLTRKFTGYKAYSYQPYFHLLPEDKRKDLIDEILKMYGDDVEVQDFEIENDSATMFGVEPLIVSGNLTNEGLITKAGNKYIFKAGDLIGPQMELYQVEKRKLPTETYYNRKYVRHLEIEIPEGYAVKNLEDLNMEVLFDKEGKNVDGFVSSYKVDGNVIKVDIEEYYNQIFISVEDFEEYRKVINAAADFNKVNLVFVKK